MEAKEIIEYLRNKEFTVKTDGQYLDLAPAAKVTSELIERLRKHKPAIIAELKREERREKVLQMLEERPEIQRAFVADTETDPGNVILSMAIRNAGTFELLIPKHKYDPFAVLEIIQKAAIQ
ncbi:MAG: hypothetical protein JNL77_00660 [Nitrosomonas sp.]|nr:hypothetical protein [Nitrosomonas sp.]